jgi:RHS repeat-associated protein
VSPWLYAGHRLEFASGLVYMKARWYSQATGTFVGVDPVVAGASDPQSYNAYSYARNNPISFNDPTGMFLEWGWGGGLWAAGREGGGGPPQYPSQYRYADEGVPIEGLAAAHYPPGPRPAPVKIEDPPQEIVESQSRAGSSEDRFNVPGEGGLFGGIIGAPKPSDVRTQSVEDLRAEFEFLEKEALVGAEEQLTEQLREVERLNQLPFLERVRALPRRFAINARIQELEIGVARNSRIFERQTEILRELNRRGETLGLPRRRLTPGRR